MFPAVLTGSSVPVTIVGGSATASAATIPQAMEGLPYKTPVGSFAEPDLEVGNTRNFRGSPMQGKENFGWQHKLEPWEGDGSSRKTDGYNWRPWRPDIPQYFGEPWKDDGRRPDIPQPLEAVEADPDSPYFGERWKDDGRRPDLRYFGEPSEGDPWKDDGRRPDIPQYFGEPWKDDGRRPDIPQYLEEAKRKLLPQNPDPLPVTTPYGDSTNLLIAKHRTTQLEAVLGQKRAIGPGLSDDQVAKFEKNNPVSNLKPSELPGFADTFSEVGKLMGSLYGRDASGFGQPEIGAYGARGQAYNIDGEYNLKTNRLSLSRDVMERFSKGDANAKNTVRHELAHYFQDMMAGDVDGIRALKGSGIEEANRKLRGMGLEPDKGQSSELQKGTLSEAPEAMAEMVAKYFEGPSRLDQASAPGFGGVTNHFNFGDDMKAFVAGMTDMAKTGLAAEFAQMRGDFAGLLAVLALHQGGGADVIVNAQ